MLDIVKRFLYSNRYIIIFLCIIPMWWGLRVVSPPYPKKLTIASGNKSGGYFLFAQRYKKFFAKQGIDLQVLETAGSVENFQLLKNKKVDIAFIQGGVVAAVDPDGKSSLKSVASLYYEPLWIFTRVNLHIKALTELRGKRIGIGAPLSGTKLVASQLLTLNGITSENSQLVTSNFKESERLLREKKLDAAFFIGSVEGLVVKNMLKNKNFKLMNFRRHHAYSRNFLFIKEIHLYEGMIDLSQNIPAEDLIIISTVSTIAVRDDIHTAIVQLLLSTMQKVHGSRSPLHPSIEFPSLDYLELPIHHTAVSYFRYGPNILYRYLPFWLASIVYRFGLFLLSIITILIPLLKILPALYQMQIKRKIGKCYRSLLEIKTALKKKEMSTEEAREATQKLFNNIVKTRSPLTFQKDFYLLRLHLQIFQAEMDTSNVYTIHLDDQKDQEKIRSLEQEDVFQIFEGKNEDSGSVFHVKSQLDIVSITKSLPQNCAIKKYESDNNNHLHET